MKNTVTILLTCLLVASAWAADDGLTPEERAWLEDDAEARALAVNEGKLEFIAPLHGREVHSQKIRIVLTEKSLQDGWVHFIQCHENIDPVNRAEIVYRRGRTRGIAVDDHGGIGELWVEGASLQLRDIGDEAWLCMRAEVRALQILDEDAFLLRNGPFMRRFLDGYYPMHVNIDVELPSGMTIDHISPEAQKGFKVKHTVSGIRVDAWFEGRLLTEMLFSRDADDTLALRLQAQ